MDAPATRHQQKPATRLTADANRADIVSIMELLYFAYRDFIAEPDAMLAELGFGRAHHRILHFVGRHPGLRVSELLAILRITKQSLGRVLRELIERGYVMQEEGPSDRRQRLLHLTPKGQELLERLEVPQIARVAAALERAGPRAREIFVEILLGLVDAEEREQVLALCGLTAEPTTQEGGDGGKRPTRADRG